MSGEEIVLSPSDGFLIVDALRYARGRGPAILDYTCWCIAYHWKNLPVGTRRSIARDVQLEVELRADEPPEVTARHRHETPNWEKLLDLAEQELTE